MRKWWKMCFSTMIRFVCIESNDSESPSWCSEFSQFDWQISRSNHINSIKPSINSIQIRNRFTINDSQTIVQNCTFEMFWKVIGNYSSKEKKIILNRKRNIQTQYCKLSVWEDFIHWGIAELFSIISDYIVRFSRIISKYSLTSINWAILHVFFMYHNWFIFTGLLLLLLMLLLGNL